MVISFVWTMILCEVSVILWCFLGMLLCEDAVLCQGVFKSFIICSYSRRQSSLVKFKYDPSLMNILEPGSVWPRSMLPRCDVSIPTRQATSALFSFISTLCLRTTRPVACCNILLSRFTFFSLIVIRPFLHYLLI